MKRIPLLGVVAWAFSAFMLASVLSAASQAADHRMIEIILDASGSMAGKLSSGERKIDAAKRAVAELETGTVHGRVSSLK